MFFRIPLLVILSFAMLSGCAAGSLQRDAIAAQAKTRMLGLSREDVLACMGPPRKKSSEGETEVWSYHSSDGQTSTDSGRIRTYGYDYTRSARNKNHCTVNVVMKNGFVKAVNYLGPKATYFFSEHDQCGYAVEACAH